MSNQAPKETPALVEFDERRDAFVAKTPHGQGEIVLPGGMTGGRYKKLANAVKRQDGDLDDAFRLESRWRAMCALGTINVTHKGELYTNETPFDDVDFRILKWSRDVLDEWLAPFLVGEDWRETLTTLLAAKL